tara:strand:- start:36 stop:140 length:105 start_codon:yes stop_codon:yes gene_type:complete
MRKLWEKIKKWLGLTSEVEPPKAKPGKGKKNKGR